MGDPYCSGSDISLTPESLPDDITASLDGAECGDVGEKFIPCLTVELELSITTQGSSLALNWTDLEDIYGVTVTSYTLYRKLSTAPRSSYSSVYTGTDLTFEDIPPLVKVDYEYRVLAAFDYQDQSGLQALSNEVIGQIEGTFNEVYIVSQNAKFVTRYSIDPSTYACTAEEFATWGSAPAAILPGVGNVHFNQDEGHLIASVGISLYRPIFTYPTLAFVAQPFTPPPVYPRGVRELNTNDFVHSRGTLYAIVYGLTADDSALDTNSSTTDSGGGSAYLFSPVVGADGFLYWFYKATNELYKIQVFPSVGGVWILVRDLDVNQSISGDGCAIFNETHFCVAISQTVGGGDSGKAIFYSCALDGSGNVFRYALGDYDSGYVQEVGRVYAKGDYVYVLMHRGNPADNTYTLTDREMIYVFDFSDPTDPAFVQAISLNFANRIRMCDAVFSENRMYIAAVRQYQTGVSMEIHHNDGYLILFDITDRSTPVHLATSALPLVLGQTKFSEDNQDIGIGHPQAIDESRNLEITI